jgi:hypothetical protein
MNAQSAQSPSPSYEDKPLFVGSTWSYPRQFSLAQPRLKPAVDSAPMPAWRKMIGAFLGQKGRTVVSSSKIYLEERTSDSA